MWIEPSILATSNLGDKFNITVWLNVTQKSFAWQIKLYFNSTHIRATKIGYTNGNRSAFFSEFSSMPVTPIINNEEGYILHGETLLGNVERASGYGSLIWVEFNLIQIPPQNHVTLNFSVPYGIDTFILTSYFDTIPFEIVDGAIISVVTKPPILLYLGIITLVTIMLGTVVTIWIFMRRRLKKHE